MHVVVSCVLVSVVVVSGAKRQGVKQAVRDLAGGLGLYTPLEALRSGGGERRAVEGSEKKGEGSTDPAGKWGGREVKSITVQMFPFLPPDSSFALCPLLFFLQTLVSDLIWSRLLTCFVTTTLMWPRCFPLETENNMMSKRGNCEGSATILGVKSGV